MESQSLCKAAFVGGGMVKSIVKSMVKSHEVPNELMETSPPNEWSQVTMAFLNWLLQADGEEFPGAPSPSTCSFFCLLQPSKYDVHVLLLHYFRSFLQFIFLGGEVAIYNRSYTVHAGLDSFIRKRPFFVK